MIDGRTVKETTLHYRYKNRIKHCPARRQQVFKRNLAIKEDYKNSIHAAITTSWKNLCTKQDQETIWQALYRVLKRCGSAKLETLIRDPTGTALSATNSAEHLAGIFYPLDDPATDTEEQSEMRRKVQRLTAEARGRAAVDHVNLFSDEEVLQVMDTISPKKAPGGMVSQLTYAKKLS